MYEDGGIDVDNYTRIIQYISDALTECEHVGLIVPGHPRVGVTIVQLLQKSSQDKAFTFHCYPGISSFDAMINDIGIDPLEEGVSILDANRLIIYDYAMDPASIILFIMFALLAMLIRTTHRRRPQIKLCI